MPPYWCNIRASEDELFANLYYLFEHGLIFTDRYPHPLPNEPSFLSVKITADGLDFLQDDGGISAMRNTVTVRFDAEEIRTVLAEKVAVSDLPKPERDRLTHAVRSLPAEALRQLTRRVLDRAIKGLPDTLRLIQTFVDRLS